MNKLRCTICKKRYVTQQEWKTELEKKQCLSCTVFSKTLDGVMTTLQNLAEEKGLKLNFSTELLPIKK